MNPEVNFTLKDIFNELPNCPKFKEGIRRAPKREFNLSIEEQSIHPSIHLSLHHSPCKEPYSHGPS